MLVRCTMGLCPSSSYRFIGRNISIILGGFLTCTVFPEFILSFIAPKITLKFSTSYTMPSVHRTESQSPHYHHTIAASQPAHRPVYDTQILGTYHQN
jgi:hypothetical protein